MRTKNKTIIIETPRIWADADVYVTTPASDALEHDLDEIFIAVQRRDRTLKDAFTETSDPGLALALALQHGLRGCPDWSDPARVSRALVQGGDRAGSARRARPDDRVGRAPRRARGLRRHQDRERRR